MRLSMATPALWLDVSDKGFLLRLCKKIRDDYANASYEEEC